MEIKTMYSQRKQMELKAKAVASTIFEFHFESRIFDSLDKSEKLGILTEKIDKLNNEYKNKPYALLVAKRLGWLVDDYIEKHQLCAHCFKELSYKTIIKQTYYDSEAGVMYCDACGYQEAM